jgi:hypothetical protein
LKPEPGGISGRSSSGQRNGVGSSGAATFFGGSNDLAYQVFILIQKREGNKPPQAGGKVSKKKNGPV